MVMLTMRHDFRAPEFAPEPTRGIYAAAMEQFRWADRHGFDFLVVSEHHGVDDGWMPAPLTIAAAALGATERVTVMVSAALAPLHDPIRLAEQIAVIDNAFPGRLMVVLGAGYREEEFAMAGVDHAARGRLLEEHVAVMLEAWKGEPFEWRGREVVVTPRPESRPHPMVLLGGGVPAAARRAARLRLPMLPMNDDPRVEQAYYAEAERVGFTGGFVMIPAGPTFVHVTRDPDRTWPQIAPYLLYETRTYSSFQTAGQHSAPQVDAETEADLRAAPNLLVAPPEQVIDVARALPASAALNFHPLAGGLPPALAQESLDLFAAEVLPALRPGE